MIVIGADTHKRTHALAAVDAGTGRVRGKREIEAEEPGHLAAVRWARGLDEERVWAIEDCRAVSRRLEQALLAAGERVVRVAPHRMGASRKGERRPGKSDEIDALAIATSVVFHLGILIIGYVLVSRIPAIQRALKPTEEQIIVPESEITEET